jgi:hypothetical protein
MKRPVDPRWWDDGAFEGRNLRDPLAQRDIGAIFRYLKARQFSWSRVAPMTGLGAGRVSEIARGRRVVSEYAVLERIAVGLGVPRAYMGLASVVPPANSNGSDPSRQLDAVELNNLAGWLAHDIDHHEVGSQLPHQGTCARQTGRETAADGSHAVPIGPGKPSSRKS